jgi:hypothetical protein
MKNSVKLMLYAVSFLLFSILYSANAAAVVTYGEWQNAATSISITDGQSAYFDASIFSMNPSITATITFYDAAGNQRSLYSGQTSDYSVNQRITVNQATYSGAGSYQIIIQASDSIGDSTYSTLNLNVQQSTIITSTSNVTITSTPLTTAKKYNAYTYLVTATGGNATITYSLTTAPAGMTINNATGVISWTPAQSQVGSFSVIARATDGSTSATQSFTISVPNSAPVLRSISDINVVKGENAEITASATDADNDPITYSIDSSSFTQDGSKFTWDTDETGTFTFTVTASDGTLTDSETFDVEVKKVNHEVTIKSATISKEEFYPGEILNIEVEIENKGNVDENDLTVYASSSLFGSASTYQFNLDQDDSVKKTLQLTIPSDAKKDTYTLTVTCEDDTTYQSFTVNEKAGAAEVSITPVEEAVVSKGIATEKIILVAVLVILIILTIVYINKKKDKNFNLTTEKFK